MEEEELIAQSATVPTMYFDGFGAYRKINGVLRAVGFVLGTGAQLNLIVSLVGADLGNREVRRVLDEKPINRIKIWSGTQMAH